LTQKDRHNKFALNFKSYGLAIIVHLILLGVIMFNLFWSPSKKIKVGGAEVQPIQAQVIDESLLTQELDKLKKDEELKKQEELDKQQKLEDLEQQALLKEEEIKKLEEQKKIKEEEAKQEQLKAEELTKQRELEEEKTQEAEKKRLAEEARLKELAIEKEKEEEEKKKEELAKKKKAEEAEKKKQAEAEKKRKLEEEKKKKDELAKKKREEDKRKKEEAEKKKKQAELEAALAQEQARSQAAALFSRYTGPIKAKVTNSWVRPGNLRPGARAKVLVRVSPQGDVLTARIQQGSGDPIFDRSVINAVYKASPLPIPNDPRLYPHYRDFVFNFDPPG